MATSTEIPLLPDAPTPSIVIDERILDRSIAAMATFAAGSGLALRPHVKTHKSLEIARRQMAAGAAGITVATVSEAEVFAEGGFGDILVAYPLWLDAERTVRLRRVLDRARLIVGVDSVEGAERLAAATIGLHDRLSVLVEIDSGHHRSGVDPVEAGSIAAGARDAALDVAGVFTFPGHSYSPTERRTAALGESAALAAAVRSLSGSGISARIVSGGSTPSARLADPGVLTEIRPGVSVFNDAQQWELGSCAREDIALSVLGTVVSRRRDRLILDTGSKVLGGDRASWATGYGRLLDHPDARITALSEHHATVTGIDLAPGTRVRVVPNHVCIAANLVDEYLVVRDGARVDRWPVDARGANT